jgi:protein TonB
MVSPHTLQNLAAYMIQIAVLTAIAELLLRVVPVAAAGFRYAYWRLVLAGALVLPWLLRQTPSAVPQADVQAAAAHLPFGGAFDLPGAVTEAASATVAWPALLAWTLAAGVALRILWVAAGVLRLRSLRRRGIPIDEPIYEEIQQRLGTAAELRSVPGLAQPVTFGLRCPIVLLPGEMGASADLRRAVVTHELVHVLRRDWFWVIAEEALRALFWFHPAIWWLTSRIQLAREEFTDHLTVLATGSRRAYMEALLAFSEKAGLEPAPAFARRAHLFHRIVMLSKEAAMSSRRIVLSGAVIALLLAAGGWYASEAFPVVKPPVLGATVAADAQLPAAPPQQVNRVTPENPIPRRLFSTPIPYPPELAGSGFTAAVQMSVVLNASGSVGSATRGSIAISGSGARTGGAGPDEDARQRAMNAFAEAASRGIRQWQYDPPAQGPLQFYVAVTFRPGVDAAISQSDSPGGVVAGPGGARIATPSDLTAISGRGRGAAPALPSAGGVSQPVRVGGNIRAPMQIRRVNPVYPEIAQAARVQGVVILEAVIDEQGRVSTARILRSIPLLDQAAIDAVLQWEYTQTLLNGAPVPVIMTVTVQFTLAAAVPF